MSAHPGLVAVPDTDGELLALLGVLEQVLTSLGPFDDDPEDWRQLASPLGDCLALDALRQVISELAAAERSPAPQPVAPDGHFELVPLRFLTLDAADLVVIGEAVAALGRATLPGVDEFVAEVLAEYASDRRQRPAELVAGAARAHGLLDLCANADTVLLAERLARGSDPVVLTPPELAAYERLTERVLAMFHAGDPLARFLYRG
ncbi:MAG: hypothetical protein M3Q48_12445 [Actinomycetota bacterium]|nr:hypothetical protein [Actinomycetota bacterium]